MNHQPNVVEVGPLPWREEMLAVVRALAAIYLLIFFFVWGRRAPEAESAPLFPFQVLFAQLPAAEQYLFRQLGEGLTEALYIRAEEGSWPPAAELAAEGIPPFAPDPLRVGAYAWRERIEGRTIQYLGEAEEAERFPSFLLQIVEPDPAVPNLSHLRLQSAQSMDEAHRRLPDGTILDVSIWIRAGPLPPTLSLSPMTQGWRQIVISPQFRN